MAGPNSTQTRLVGIKHRQDASLHGSSNRVSFENVCRDASYVCIVPSLVCGHSYLLVAPPDGRDHAEKVVDPRLNYSAWEVTANLYSFWRNRNKTAGCGYSTVVTTPCNIFGGRQLFIWGDLSPIPSSPSPPPPPPKYLDYC